MVDFKKFRDKKKQSIKDKFKKREQETLEKIYEDREKRTSGENIKSSIFKTELLEELEITEFKPNKDGEYFIEILPCSFDPSDKYFREIAKHNQVGINNEQFICMQRLEENKKPCYRCEAQKQLYKQFEKPTDEITALYPSDRIIYLIWDRTKEMVDEESPEYILSIWDAPKKGFHTELQSQVRDKKSKKILDISDVHDDGDGRTVYFKIVKKETEIRGKKSKIPTYEGIDLVSRDEGIPDEVLKKLSELFNAAEETSMHPIDFLLNFPEYEDIKEAMETEISSLSKGKKESGSKKNTFDKFQLKKQKQGIDDITDITELEEELSNLSRKKLLLWVNKKNNDELTDLVDPDMNDEELRDTIIEYYQTKLEEF